MRARAIWGGTLAVLLWAVAAAYGALGLPVLPLYDGVQPPSPYRWVDPPPEFEAANQPPLPGNQTVPADDLGVGFAAATNDAQAQLIVAGGAVEGQPEDARSLRVVVTPLDPDSLGPPPAGLLFGGNAYEFEASYVPGGEPLELNRTATIVERYATRASTLLRWSGSRWERVEEPQVVRGSLQVFAESAELGTFVTAGPPRHMGGGTPLLLFVGLGVAGGALAGGLAWFLLRRRRKPRKRGGPKATMKRKPAKGKAPRGKKRSR